MSLHDQLPGIQRAAARFFGAFYLGRQRFGRHRTDNVRRDFILYVEQVIDLPIVSIGPQLMFARNVYQLRRHAHAVAVFTHTASDHVAHIEFLGDTDVDPPLLWGEWGLVEFSNPSDNALLDTNTFFGHGLFIIIDDD